MRNVDEMTKQDILDFLLAEDKRKAKQREANKKYLAAHPMTDEQKAERLAYNRERLAKQKRIRESVFARAKELGLTT